MNRVDAPNATSAGSLGGRQIPSHNPGHKRERNTENVVRPVGQTTRWERVRGTERHALDLLTRVSSESDSAALAPLQQELRLATRTIVQSLVMVAGWLRPGSLRDGSPGDWQVWVSSGGAGAPPRPGEAARFEERARPPAGGGSAGSASGPTRCPLVLLHLTPMVPSSETVREDRGVQVD